jgi:hypothetical protein
VSCCQGKSSCKIKCSPFDNKGLLTIGMATYDDFDGVYFTTQSLLLYHKEVTPYIRIVIVDNNPYSKQGQETKEYAAQIGATYIPFADYKATTVKGIVFEQAKTPYVLCIDSHVMIESGALLKLLLYYQCNENTNDLLQGPLVSEDPRKKDVWTHFEPKWRSQMFGVWSTDERGKNPDEIPFDIPMQGMGLFSCRKDAWVGFNDAFRGFGGEEWYIHQKFRNRGSRTLCLPFLRWSHRFRRPNGTPYKVCLDDKIRNYYIGFLELGLDVSEITNYYCFEEKVDIEKLNHLLFQAKCLQPS